MDFLQDDLEQALEQLDTSINEFENMSVAQEKLYLSGISLVKDKYKKYKKKKDFENAVIEILLKEQKFLQLAKEYNKILHKPDDFHIRDIAKEYYSAMIVATGFVLPHTEFFTKYFNHPENHTDPKEYLSLFYKSIKNVNATNQYVLNRAKEFAATGYAY